MLGEAGNFIGTDGEVLPADNGAGGVGNSKGVANGRNAGLATDNSAADGVGLSRVYGNSKEYCCTDRLKPEITLQCPMYMTHYEPLISKFFTHRHTHP